MGQNVRCYHCLDTHSRHRYRTPKLVFNEGAVVSFGRWKISRVPRRVNSNCNQDKAMKVVKGIRTFAPSESTVLPGLYAQKTV